MDIALAIILVVNWVSTVSGAVIVISALGGSIYAVAYFQHPDDKVTGLFPKFVVVLGISLSLVTPLLVTLDVSNRNGGLLPMEVIWASFLMLIGFMVTILIPWCYFFYDIGDGDTLKDRLCSAFQWEFVLAVTFFTPFSLLYSYMGVAEVPVDEFNSTLIHANVSISATGLPDCAPGCTEPVSTFLIVPVSFVVYLSGCLALFGYFFLIVFGGIGLVSLPLDLILAYVYRPKKLELEGYARARIDIKERATDLIEFGKTLQAQMANSRKTAHHRVMFQRFKTCTSALESNWSDIKSAYKNGGTPLLATVWLVLGCVGGALSILWIVHLTLYIVYARLTGEPFMPFLNWLFVVSDRIFPLFTAVMYAMFAFWLLWAVARGNVKLGIRVACFPIFPLRVGGTYMSAMLIHTGIVLISTVAVVFLCTVAFDLYVRLTAASMVFGIQISNLQGMSDVWMVCEYALFGVIALTMIYFGFFPKDRDQSESLQKDMEEMIRGTPPSSSCCVCM